MKRIVVSVLLLLFVCHFAFSQCADTLFLFPINNNVEGEPPCMPSCQAPCPLMGDWQNSIFDGTDWTVNMSGTSSSGTGPNADNTLKTPAGLYMYIESSTPCSPGIEAILESQCVNLDSIASPFISFYYHMFGIAMGDLFLDIYDGSSWSTLLTISGQQQTVQTDPWIMADVDLSSYSGIVQFRFRGVTGTSFTSDMAIDDIIIYDKIPNDVGAVVLSSPISGCGLTSSENVVIGFKNFGAVAQSSIPVGYSFNGGTPVLDTINTNVLPGDTVFHTFLISANLSSVGSYSFDAWTSMTTDLNFANDSLLGAVVLNGQLFPLIYDVEDETACLANCTTPCDLTGTWSNVSTDDHDWIADFAGTSSTATGPLVDNTLGTANGQYLYTEASGCSGMEAILESPCLDLSQLNSPALKFSYHMMGATMGNLFVEIKSGGTWNNVFTLTGQQQTNQTDHWIEEEISLAAYSGVVNLRFRGITGSSFTSDMAIDDIVVFDKPPTDVGVTSINSPNPGYSLGCSELFSISVKNYGTDVQDTIPVAYSIDGNSAIRDTLYYTLNPDNEVDFVFPVALDLSQSGTYSFDAWTELSGDLVTYNDSVQGYEVVNDSNLVLGTEENYNSIFGYPAPYGNGYTCVKHQIIIRASELDGFSAGDINGLGFNVKTANGVALQDFEIKMKLTSDSVVTSSFDNNGLTSVWGPQDYSDFTGWNMHNFSTPFYWDGQSNILLETCFCNGVNNYSSNAEMYNTNTNYLSTIYQYTDQDSSHCVNASVAATVFSRPDIRIDLLQNQPPTAGFTSNLTISCMGGAIQFMDSSDKFPTCWYWDFGDGSTDSVQNPLHTYNDTGLYTITLIAYNDNGSDTAIYSNYIDIKNGAGPPVCNPVVSDSLNNLGIQNVTFNTISNSTAGIEEGYSDYSCTAFTTVLIGSLQSISVETGSQWEEDVRVWIDYNCDGNFDTTEIILSSNDVLINHSAEFFVPQSVVTDTMLRMRVLSDYASLFDGNACDTLTYGQAEDYGVTIESFTTPPIPDFSYTILDPCLGIVSFSDYSEYYPTSLLWEFGNGSSDTGSNVTHAFGTGIFDVSLIASNSFGSDTITKTIFIDSVVSDFILPDDTIDIDVHHLYINTSYGSNAWEWDFGDGGNSTDEFPYHTYTSPGIYQISLLATNTSTGCLDSIIKTIVVLSPNATGITPDVLSVIKVAPNPTTGMIFIQYGLESNSNLYLIIKDVLGQDVFAKEIEVNSSGYDEIDLTKYPKGIYFVNLSKLNSLNQHGLNEINTYKLIVE